MTTCIVKNTFSMQLKILRIVGLYPPSDHKKLYSIYAYIIWIVFIVPMPILATVYLFLAENVDMEEISDNAFIICEMGCFVIKVLPFILNSDQVRKSIYLLEAPLFNLYSEKQATIIDEDVKICKRNCSLFLSFCGVSLIAWGIKPFFTTEYKLPLQIWLPFDITAPNVFYTVYFYSFVAIGDGAISNGVIDPLIAGLAVLATSQVKLLKDNLKSLGEYAAEKQTQEINTIVYERIKLCINHHAAILDFFRIFENTYSLVIFTQFTASVIVICVSCWQMSVLPLLSVPFFAMFLFLITMLGEIFLYCYYGATLFEESNTLTNAIYMGKWYKYDVKSKNALIILMERSKKPIILSAGKILDLSLVTFTTILRRAYSLLAVLKNY